MNPFPAPSNQMNPARSLQAEYISSVLFATIGSRVFPCVAAKSVMNRSEVSVGVYPDMAAADGTSNLCFDFFEAATRDKVFAAVFLDNAITSEKLFHDYIWRQLDLIACASAALFAWDPSVSEDRDDPHYSFSFAGKAYFVVGMSPFSQRISRRFPWPALVFNPRSRLDALRANGTFDTIRDMIRTRDTALDGSENPLLSDHGETSEAPQYSGFIE